MNLDNNEARNEPPYALDSKVSDVRIGVPSGEIFVEGHEIRPWEHGPMGGLRLKWAQAGVGFGRFDVIYTSDDRIQIDTECMSMEFVFDVIAAYQAKKKTKQKSEK